MEGDSSPAAESRQSYITASVKGIASSNVDCAGHIICVWHLLVDFLGVVDSQRTLSIADKRTPSVPIFLG